MSQRASSPRDPTPTIFTDRWRSLNCLPYGILRFRDENFLSSQVGEIIDDAEKFSVSITARNFSPNEITINIEGNELRISALHVDNDGEKRFERRYVIPDNIVTECSETRISPDGVLTITLFKKYFHS